jgi:hypothetical protein
MITIVKPNSCLVLNVRDEAGQKDVCTLLGGSAASCCLRQSPSLAGYQAGPRGFM